MSQLRTRTVSGTSFYSIDEDTDEAVLVTVPASGMTVNLPDARLMREKQLRVARANAANGGTATVAAVQSQTISGASSVALTVIGDSLLVVSDGSNWQQLAAPLGGYLSAVFDAVGLYEADNTGAIDATTAIQNALNAAHTAGGGTVWIPRGSFKISSSLVIYSNTVLWADEGTTITLAASSNCNMIHNAAWVAGSGRDSNITIKGGTWARGSNAGSGQQLHSILMQRVDDLTIQDLAVTSSAGKYAINVYACTAFSVARIFFNTFSDGVHVSGASSGGSIRDIWGTTGDDSVALTPTDYTTYQNGDLGDITDVVIDGVFTTNTNNTRAIKLCPGTHSATVYFIRRVQVRNVKANSPIGAMYIGGDPANADTQNGSIADVDVSNIANTNTTNGAFCIQIAAGGTGTMNNFSFSHVAVCDGGANSRTVLIDASSGAITTGLMTFRDCYWVTANSPPVEVKGGAVIGNLIFETCYFGPPASTYTILMSSSNTTITSVRFVSCRLNVATASGGLIQIQGGFTQNVANVFISDLTVDQAAHALGDWPSGASTNLFIDGLRVTTVTDLIFNRSGSTINYLVGNGIVGTNGGKFGSTGTVNYNIAGKAAPTYSASITPIATDGSWQTITVTNGTAFTINAPTNPPDSTHSAEITVEILNSSGGAMGVITWNAAFVFAGATWTNPASTKKRFARFEWNGAAWVCTGIAAGDY